MADRPYRPIDCSVHDRLESAATLRQRTSISYRGRDGEVLRTEDRVVDVFTRAGAELLRLESGLEVRLDDLLEVGGVAVEPAR